MKAIFATDLSPASLAALDCLCGCQAEDFEELILLHVIDVDMYTEGGSVPLFLDADRKMLDEQAARLHELGLTVRVRVEQGSTVDEVRRVAAEEGVGLVIVGNVGRGGLRGHLLGGTAEALASEAHVPVLVERVSDASGAWCRLAQGHTFRRTLVAVDFSPASRRALETVTCMAGVEAVRLVHVAGHDEDAGLGSIEERANQLETWATGASQRAKAGFELREGDPVEELRGAAEAWDATCIAAGLCGHGPVYRLMWGSVSSGLARTADVPVLLVPPAESQGGAGQ